MGRNDAIQGGSEDLEETRLGEVPAVVPQLTGSAWITGRTDLVVDPDDPFPEGFTVGDLWGLTD